VGLSPNIFDENIMAVEYGPKNKKKSGNSKVESQISMLIGPEERI
jgi:hypothetical protein